MENLCSNLEQEFDSLTKSLVDIDSSIRKVTGMDPSRSFEHNGNKLSRNRPRSMNDGLRRPFGSVGKRRYSDVNNEEVDSNIKRSLQSQVVATSWETKQRNQVLEEQKNDTKSMKRNKRMFGLILGTLEKFKNEESQRRDSKREEIEKKLDQADEKEREAAKKEQIELFKQRREKRIKLKCLEQKIQMVQVHKEWEESQQFMGNFIETKSKPNLFYLPVKHNSETQKRLQETKDKYRIIFAEKRAKVQKELNDIEENFKFDMKFATDDNNDDELLKNDEQNDLEQPVDRNDEKDDDLNIKHDDTISDSNKLEINVSETSSPTKSKNTHHHHKHHHHHSHNHNHHNDKIPEDEDIITKSEFNDTKEIENDENISFDEIKMEDISMDQNQSFEPMYE